MANAVDVLKSLAGNALLFLLVFGMSATVSFEDIKSQMQNRKALLLGAFLQFIVMPLLGFLVVKAIFPTYYSVKHAISISLLVVTSSPGGSYSNLFCSLFNADLALSVSMTAISTLLSIALLPLNLLLYTHFSFDDNVVENLNWQALFLSLLVVVFAIALGMLSSHLVASKRFQKWANHLGSISGFLLILFSATVTNTGADSDSKIWSRDWRFYVGVSLPCVLGLAIASLMATFCKLKPPERVSVAVECCYQNVGIATSLALTMFSGSELSDAMGVPFFYGVTEIVLITVYCLCAWKCGWTKAPPEVGLCKALCTSYEVRQSFQDKKMKSAESNDLDADDGQTVRTDSATTVSEEHV